MTGHAPRFRSRDGLMSSADPSAVALWESIGQRMADERANWTEILRAMGVKLAHPDDGWVNRERGTFSLSWYAQFDDRPEVGDLIAFGSPPRGEHYQPCRDRSSGKRKAPVRQPESADSGYRVVRVTSVARTFGILGPHQEFAYADEGVRMPPAPRRWWRARNRNA